MKIRKNDQVLIISGKDKGKKGKIVAVLRKRNKIVVEGINIVKKHMKPKNEGQKGQIIDMPSPLDVSKVKLICPKCGQPTRVGYKIEGERKYRICKKCGQEI